MLGKILLGCIVVLGCNKSEGGDSLGSAMATSAAKSGSGGFSADLAKEMGVGKGSAGSAAKPDDKVAMAGSAKPGEAGDTKAGDAKAGDTKAGKAGDTKAGDMKAGDMKAGAGDMKAGDMKAGDTKAGDMKAGDMKAGDAKAGDAKAGTAKAGDTKAGDAKAGDTKAGDAKAGDAKAGDAKAGIAKAGDTKPPPDIKPAQTPVVAPAVPVKPPANLAAIKLSLLPNWDRDIGEAGTFQYVVRIKNTSGATKTFTFHYGYDDPRAPSDREQYKKFLLDQKIMTGELRDRQRGGAWFIEGADENGAPAFRYVVLYGGKRLICYGSLYKDAESNKLGDDRDQTIIQAKQICETLAL